MKAKNTRAWRALGPPDFGAWALRVTHPCWTPHLSQRAGSDVCWRLWLEQLQVLAPHPFAVSASAWGYCSPAELAEERVHGWKTLRCRRNPSWECCLLVLPFLWVCCVCSSEMKSVYKSRLLPRVACDNRALCSRQNPSSWRRHWRRLQGCCSSSCQRAPRVLLAASRSVPVSVWQLGCRAEALGTRLPAGFISIDTCSPRCCSAGARRGGVAHAVQTTTSTGEGFELHRVSVFVQN